MNTRDRILAYVRDSQHSPTVEEIAQHVGRSKSTVHHHLIRLQGQGFVGYENHRVYARKDLA